MPTKFSGIAHWRVDDCTVHRSLKELPQYEVLGGQCSVCAHIGWVNRSWVIARLGNHYLINVRARLRCRVCWNRRNNDLLIGHMDRNA